MGRDVLSRRSVPKEVEKTMIKINKTVNIRRVVIWGAMVFFLVL